MENADPALTTSALRAAVVAAAASGARAFEAAVVVSEGEPTSEDLAVLREFGDVPLLVAGPDGVVPVTYRSGFACFVGRPNAGKSTLTNALIGQKVAITSSRPQTTRHAVRGIIHRPEAQLVLVDTPGLHKPRTLLGQRLNDLVRETYASVDLICFCVTADDKLGPGDRFIAAELAQVTTPVIAVVTKTDLVSKDRVGEQLLAVNALHDWADLVPTSAVDGFQVDLLRDLLIVAAARGPDALPRGRADR